MRVNERDEQGEHLAQAYMHRWQEGRLGCKSTVSARPSQIRISSGKEHQSVVSAYQPITIVRPSKNENPNEKKKQPRTDRSLAR